MKKCIFPIFCLLFVCVIFTSFIYFIYWLIYKAPIPELVYKRAISKIERKVSYQYEGNFKMELNLKYSNEFSNYYSAIEQKVLRKNDYKNNKFHIKITINNGGYENNYEGYVIGGDVYYREGIDEFEKGFEKSWQYLDENSYDFLRKVNKHVKHHKINEETVNDINCYVFEIEMDETFFNEYLNYLSSDKDKGLLFGEGKVVGDTKFKIWISKDKSEVVKSYMTIEKIVLKNYKLDENFEIERKNIEISVNYYDWGEDFELPEN